MKHQVHAAHHAAKKASANYDGHGKAKNRAKAKDNTGFKKDGDGSGEQTASSAATPVQIATAGAS